jgi:hypothetical protein
LNGTVSSIRVVSEVTVPEEETARRAWNDVPGIPLDVSRESWRFDEEAVFMEGEGIERIVRPGNSTYVFNRNPLQVENTLTFVLSEVDEASGDQREDVFPVMESLTFGVTTVPVDNILINSLPEDPYELQTRRFAGKWFVAADVVPSPVTAGRKLSIKRNLNGITLKSGVKTIQIIIPIDATKIIFPFFYFSGRVRKIDVMSAANMTALSEENPRSRTRSETSSTDHASTCVICLTNQNDRCILPCGHVCLCGDCADRFLSRDASNGSTERCPTCRGMIESIIRVFLP